MAIFNSAPSIDQLTSITHRNLAGFATGKSQRSDVEALNILRDTESKSLPGVYGFPNLVSAASHFAKEPLISIGTMDTDGVLVKAEKDHYLKKCEAIKSVLLPSLFPANGRLEKAVDIDGIRGFGELLKQNMFQLLGISISSQRLPRQKEIKKIYSEAGARDYICGLPRGNVPNEPVTLSGVWNDFLAKLEDLRAITDSLEINYNHFFDVISPIRMMAFNNGEEGIFARWVSQTMGDWGLNVQTSLVEFNPFFPSDGVLLDKDLHFRDIS